MRMPRQALRIRMAGPASTLSKTAPTDASTEQGSMPNRIGWPETSYTKLVSKPAVTKPTAVT